MAERVSYVPIPYASRERYTPDTRRLGDLLGLQGANSRDLAIQQGNTAQQKWLALSAMFSRFVQDREQAQARKEANAIEQDKIVRAEQFKRDEMAEKAAERKAAADRQYALDQRQARMDASTRGSAAVSDIGGYGPLAESSVDDVMQSPAASRTRYNFGPGTANGPEVMPNAAQAAAAERLKALETFAQTQGGVVNATGSGVVTPPKPPSIKPEPAMVDGKRTFVIFGEGGAKDLMGRPVNAQPIPPQGPAERNPIAIIGPDGNPIYVDPSKAVGQRPPTAREQPSEDERKSAGWHGQMSDALGVIDEIGPTLSQQEIYQIQTLPQEGLIGLANRGKLSENAKRYLRAFEQFTEARLRSVSGAAIGANEYAADRRTYAQQYGETPKIAADRMKARNRALESLKTRAGRAMPRDAAKSDGSVMMVAPNGQEQSVPADQVEHYKSLGAKVKG